MFEGPATHRVDGICASADGSGDDGRDVQVGLGAWRLANANSLIGELQYEAKVSLSYLSGAYLFRLPLLLWAG